LEENYIGGGTFCQGGEQGKKHIPATQAVVLNEGEVSRRTQSLARGGAGVVNHFRAGPDGLEGVTGSRPRPVGAGRDPQGGPRASQHCWKGLGLERSMGRVEGALGVAGAWRPSSPTYMASSLAEEASDSSLSEGGGASG